MSSANDHWSFRDLPDDLPPARAEGARYSTLVNRSDHIRSISVHFAGTKPAPEQVDRVLRECAAYAAAQDSSFDVFMGAVWLPSADAHWREHLSLFPYGDDFFLCFDARLRQVGVRRRGGKKFVKPWPVDDVSGVCRLPYAEHVPLPLDDYPDGDEDGDDGVMGDLRAQVVRWIWYGYHSAAEIDQMMVDCADEDDDIDLPTMRAFAAVVLGKKRAAEASWPEETDNDRLVDALADLTEEGILGMQWAGDTLTEGFEVVNERLGDLDPDGERFTGACFFHSQDMDGALNEEGLSLAFGHVLSDEPADYIAVGRRVVEVLRRYGLRPEWNGSDRQRISLPGFRWRRRTPD